jgi:hypothetical protein
MNIPQNLTVADGKKKINKRFKRIVLDNVCFFKVHDTFSLIY